MMGVLMVRSWDRLKLIAKQDFIWLSIVVLGIILRLRQYLANRSLWGDESALAVNIVERSFFGLTQKLGFHQAAPLGFLLIEKISIILLGNRDYILRLFPLFSGILAVYLMYRIAKENFGVIGIFAVLMFSVNSWLIFYSSELKQYCSDVTIALLLVYLSIRCLGENTRIKDFIWLGVAGLITIWISHTSIFILAGIGLVLVLEKIVRKKYVPMVWLLGLGASWLISFGVEYIVALQDTAADIHYQTSWQTNFVPWPPWSDPQWFVKTYYFFLLIIMNRTDLFVPLFVSALALIGILSLFIRRRTIALLMILPFIMTLVASALHKYPLSYRFMLFLIPFALLLMAEGVGRIYLFMAKWQRSLALILCGIPVAVLLWISITRAIVDFRSPQTISEIRPIMKYVEENRAPQDTIYLYYGAVPGFLYYAPFYNFDDLDSDNIIMGVWRQNENKAFLHFFEDVEGLKGKNRVWFIFVEIVDCGGCEGDKQVVFTNYLDKYGTMLDSVQSVSSAAYLYDLSP
jgi:hypothetical protein